MSFELVGDPNNAYGPLDEASKGARWIEYGDAHAWLWFGGPYLDAYLIGWGRVFVGRFIFSTNPGPSQRQAEAGIRRFECLMRACAESNQIERWKVSPAQLVLYGIRTLNMDREINRALDALGRATEWDKRQEIRNRINALRGYQYRAPWANPQIFLNGEKIGS